MSKDQGSNRRASGQLAGHAAMGLAVGVAVLAGLLATDAMGLRSLLGSSDLGYLALLVLALQFGAGFATFAVVTALALEPAPKPRERWVRPWHRHREARRRRGTARRPRLGFALHEQVGGVDQGQDDGRGQQHVDPVRGRERPAAEQRLERRRVGVEQLEQDDARRRPRARSGCPAGPAG